MRRASDPQKAQRLIADALPPVVASVLEPADLETMRRRLLQLPEPPEQARLSKDEWLGALGVFLIVFVSTFPVAIPFIFMQNVGAGPARLQCDRHRDAVPVGLRLRPRERAPPVGRRESRWWCSECFSSA